MKKISSGFVKKRYIITGKCLACTPYIMENLLNICSKSFPPYLLLKGCFNSQRKTNPPVVRMSSAVSVLFYILSQNCKL